MYSVVDIVRKLKVAQGNGENREKVGFDIFNFQVTGAFAAPVFSDLKIRCYT
jgi:hypothetical protein